MKQILQHIVFPDDEALADNRELFYRGDRGYLTEYSQNGHLCLAKYQYAEFCTYLNGFSFAKWNRYTSISSLSLHLNFRGTAEITICGYKLVQEEPVRTVFSRKKITAEDPKEAVFSFPENDQMILGFELSTISDFELYDGYYEAEFPDESVREVELAITTTTFRREDFIRKNALRVKEGLFDRYPDVSEHIKMHVVDNGRTLKEEDIPTGSHFALHPNPNVGGSGGYARGMIECLHQIPAATHALLMDDDILILPESLYRTYQVLRFLKPEYYEHFIGGAMLRLEKKNIQHEDIGHIREDGFFSTCKPWLDHDNLKDNLYNELDFIAPYMYQAWWYCCIPVSMIQRNGLPLPLFIRADDAEYSLRSQAKIITMNGICLWHLGFEGKFSASMNIYQEFRNMWIAQSTTGVAEQVNLTERFKKNFRLCLLKHDYNGCEMLLRALEDYMKGPEFIMEDLGEQIMKENTSHNEKLVPFDKIPLQGIDFNALPWEDEPRKPLKTFVYRLTWNGHILWPEKYLDPKPTVITNDFFYTPGKMAMKKTYVAVDWVARKAAVREIDKVHFHELRRKYKDTMNRFHAKETSLKKAYHEQREYLISEKFWRRYLNMGEKDFSSTSK